MSKIQRYDVDGNGAPYPLSYGNYVLYDDFRARVAELEKELKQETAQKLALSEDFRDMKARFCEDHAAPGAIPLCKCPYCRCATQAERIKELEKALRGLLSLRKQDDEDWNEAFERVGMPEGYTLIRYGLFRWGWKYDCYLSNDTCWTANGAKKYAHKHAQLMKEETV